MWCVTETQVYGGGYQLVDCYFFFRKPEILVFQITQKPFYENLNFTVNFQLFFNSFRLLRIPLLEFGHRGGMHRVVAPSTAEIAKTAPSTRVRASRCTVPAVNTKNTARWSVKTGFLYLRGGFFGIIRHLECTAIGVILKMLGE